MSAEPDPIYSLEDVGPATVIHFTTDHLANQPRLYQLYEIVDSGGKNRLVLDFSTVTMITSLALVVFVSLRRKVIDKGGKLSIYGLEENLVDLFHRSRLQNFFPICQTQQEALSMVLASSR